MNETREGRNATPNERARDGRATFTTPSIPPCSIPLDPSVAVNKAMEEDAIILHKSGAITTHPWICRPNATLTLNLRSSSNFPAVLIVCPGFLRVPEARIR